MLTEDADEEVEYLADEEIEYLIGERTVGRGSIAPSYHWCPACIKRFKTTQEAYIWNGNWIQNPPFLAQNIVGKVAISSETQVSRWFHAGSE